MDLKTLVLGMVGTNCYILHKPDSKEAILIDPGDQAEQIKSYIEKEELRVVAILLTHGHFDHIMAVNELIMAYHVKVYAHREEKALLGDASLNCSEQIRRPYIVDLQETLEDEAQLSFAGFEIKVLYTPGHTKGCVCYYFPKEQVLFSGDTIFRESVGRTDLPTGNEATLLQSIQDKLLILDDVTKVYPGHGESTTIGYEKKYNPFFRGL